MPRVCSPKYAMTINKNLKRGLTSLLWSVSSTYFLLLELLVLQKNQNEPNKESAKTATCPVGDKPIALIWRRLNGHDIRITTRGQQAGAGGGSELRCTQDKKSHFHNAESGRICAQEIQFKHPPPHRVRQLNPRTRRA